MTKRYDNGNEQATPVMRRLKTAAWVIIVVTVTVLVTVGVLVLYYRPTIEWAR